MIYIRKSSLSYQYVVILVCMTFFSCTEIIPVVNDDELDQYVLNCLFDHLQPIKVSFSKTVSIVGDNKYNSEQDDWDILLFENGMLLHPEIERSTKGYVLYYWPKPGNTYRIEAEKESTGVVLVAEDTMPYPVEIDQLVSYFPLYKDYYESEVGLVQLKFTDPGNDIAYYELDLSYISVSHPVISANSEKDHVFYPTLLFTNELFKGETIELNIYSQVARPVVYLRSVSRNYFFYKKSLYGHLSNQNIDNELLFTTEPVMVYSNIENGIGVFAAYAEYSRIPDHVSTQ